MRGCGSRCLPVLVVALFASAPGGSDAAASELVTWTLSSRYVDPEKVLFGRPPPGEPERPNALRVNVLLPDGYDGKRRFPVLYLLHGTGDGYDAWAHPELGNVREVAQGLPAVIVMPEGAVGWYSNWWNGGQRGDPAWERHHLDEVIPLVEERLQIRRGRRWHAIGGNSMGGFGAMFYASQRPGYFGTAVSSSGPLSIQRPEQSSFMEATEGPDLYGDARAQEFYWRGHNPTALAQNLAATRLYVAVGDGTAAAEDQPDPFFTEQRFKPQNEEFVEAARASGAAVQFVPRRGVHSWSYARSDLADAIKWGLFEPPPLATAWSYATVAQTGDAWGLQFAFAEPPADVQEFSMDQGGRLHGVGSGSVSLVTPDGCRFSVELPFDTALPADREPPISAIQRVRLRRGALRVRGRARDRGCGEDRPVARVQLSIARREPRRRCRYLRESGRLGRRVACRRRHFLGARGTSAWRLAEDVRLPDGVYVLRTRAHDGAGNVERAVRPHRNRVVIRLR